MFIRKGLICCLVVSISFLLLSGCASTQVYKTVGLSETFPPIASDQVKVFERNEPVVENFQTIGKVTVNCNTGVSKKNAILKMQETASQQGADGIVDFHHGPGCQWRYDAGVHYSGLMVKWQAPDAPKKPLDTKFIVTRLPIINSTAPDEKMRFKNAIGYRFPMIDFPWMNDLVFKGYYVLPECDNSPGSTDNANAKLCQEAQFLVKASLLSESASMNVVVAVVHGVASSGLDHDAVLNVELIDSESGKTVIAKQEAGSAFKQWFSGIVESGSELAAGEAIKTALQDVQQVGDPVK